MKGPQHSSQHFFEAERLLRSCQIIPATEDNAAIYPALEEGVDTTTHALMAAQIHATLALALVLDRQLAAVRNVLVDHLPGRMR